ncbi:hypothetical protein DPMN_079749 [Dreissena polymorpha]|uniref:HTH psq-type domain-containing protein n=1 Tax=Dreissena polymorpha TaxID=45954 RepID=A0A9D4BT90_DREPO|nr:hypothetical protein DPMN_079749 [Dreissena polymorpha]
MAFHARSFFQRLFHFSAIMVRNYKRKVTSNKVPMYVIQRAVSDVINIGRSIRSVANETNINPMTLCRSRKKALANSVDPDETPHDAARMGESTRHKWVNSRRMHIALFWYSLLPFRAGRNKDVNIC